MTGPADGPAQDDAAVVARVAAVRPAVAGSANVAFGSGGAPSTPAPPAGAGGAVSAMAAPLSLEAELPLLARISKRLGS